MEPVDATTFRAWCHKAKRLWPLDKPVEIRRVQLKRMCGWSEQGEEQHRIRISRRLDRAATLDTLIHEFAHLWTGEQHGEGIEHSDEFWTTMGSMYRAWHRVT